MKVSGAKKEREKIYILSVFSPLCIQILQSKMRNYGKWMITELTYFLGDLTIYIYIHVGNSQEESEYDQCYNAKLGPEPGNFLYSLLLGTKGYVPLALKGMASGSAHLILTARQKLVVRVYYALRLTPNRLVSFQDRLHGGHQLCLDPQMESDSISTIIISSKNPRSTLGIGLITQTQDPLINH